MDFWHICYSQIYNPYLESLPHRAAPQPSTFKVYDIDSQEAEPSVAEPKVDDAVMASVNRRNKGHNDRFYEELDYERKVMRRKARLVTATEDAFGVVRKLQTDETGWLML